ncbi:DUF2298 domain-containing protein [Archaeoglobus profundus]|uniref:Uncharacterized membrane protein-like protein n=1 Tax=Archaeoglobus profundus (strain DSM 5631 / JCM 9629 / NBRC 100127 / Av18) TaxID=572546 RepID=D2RFG9_ARCPA|nr:DUF2298 domain-containing protein [Archaeoglobus profundus]ADB58863.1 Uncharacterized membrane protein-like protein [Archaeoglobus profundus DSM 5631]
MLEIVLWITILYIISFLSLPLADRLGLRGLSKVLGLIFLTYIVWLISFLVDFKSATFYGFMITVTVGSLLWLYDVNRISSNFRGLMIDFFKFEAVFIVFFLIYLLYEMFNPYVVGAEKMTDMAILTAITKSNSLPPYDPFLAGYRLNFYYYMGYVSYAILTILSLTTTHISYNLACATVFALAMTPIVWLISKSREKITIPFLLLAGNLMTLKMLIFGNISKAFDFWTVTRVIKGTINEFPLATLFFRDLHPHFMSIPFQIAFLIALYMWVREEKKSTAVLMSFLLGFMFTVNSWDFFTYSFLYIILSIALRRFYALALLPLAVIPFLPFHLTLNTSAVKGIGFVCERTDLISFIIAQPLVLLPLIYSLIQERKIFLTVLGISIPISLLFKFPVIVITLPTVVALLKKFYEERSFELGVALTALLLLTAVEIVYVDDAYSGEIERLNTVFKSYVQAWILLSFGFTYLNYSYERIYKSIAICLIAILWIYPIGCAVGLPTLGFKGTLDGIEFTKSYGEYNALKYLYRFSGVVVEYPGKTPYESYTYAGRVSSYTGLRSVLCNGGHELFWRFFDNETVKVLNERWRDIKEIYESKDLDYDLLEKYNVSFIYIGYLEKSNYNISYDKFSKLQKVYDDGEVVIYKVIYPKS